MVNITTNPMIHRNEQCIVVTSTGNHQGTVMQVTASTIRVQVNGQRYTFNRAKAHRTRLQRLVIEVTV